MKEYWHSVTLESELCNGCTNCLRRCPTEAIRIKNNKARIIKERCIDCGECIKVCPYHAKKALSNDLSMLKNYKFKIALVSLPLYGQFSVDKDINRIFNCFYNIGFDYVYDEAYAADILSLLLEDLVKENKMPKPLIATLCPAILRLIQIRFPSLIDNIIPFESPMEIAARLAKQEVMEKYGLKQEDIGVFYIAQCPAKITSVKKPLGLKKSFVDGAIAIETIYSKLLKAYKEVDTNDKIQRASGKGIGWARVGGQSFSIGIDNYLAVDGIENVIKVLEEIELGKLNNIDFFEGYACTTGCVGGPLNVENPFIAKTRIRKITNLYGDIKIDKDYAKKLLEEGKIGWTEEIKPSPVLKLDSDIQKAIEKMELLEKIYKELPGIDCGSCGAPSCHALAEDIVRGKARKEDCVINLKNKMKK
ncbi:[Fe-Fe] hydrogenase large subunit C-terminal domain-containing protein [Caminicella sporogenes]|uniref:[Fe-Fe] hydrogenase large subunit C-terminal domain-containing protein n=1 Tax=Caminicella sporogenes TaxID=166485 RepID=UPI00253FDB67|nr:[Fe-Fe] hydrogenase large subunit C-terminal domain-containing protein [Caminicella sporogenes]WIF94406.1 [Fe-Fe] hydrogenase large subunit C-terminal domain-containing protein [Caminicella sporogenes]